jgi:hypothetical protein
MKRQAMKFNPANYRRYEGIVYGVSLMYVQSYASKWRDVAVSAICFRDYELASGQAEPKMIMMLRGRIATNRQSLCCIGAVVPAIDGRRLIFLQRPALLAINSPACRPKPVDVCV